LIEFSKQLPSDNVTNSGKDKPQAVANPLPSGQPPSENKAKPETLSFTFTGDVLLGSTVANLLAQHGESYPYEKIGKKLKSSDLTIGNLETPVTDRTLPPEEKEYVYQTSPTTLQGLVDNGYDLFNLANNHTMDLGPEGLLDTIKHLDRYQLHHVGAGKNAEEAYEPVFIEKNGYRIGFIGLSRVIPEPGWAAGVNHPGLAITYNPERALEVIRETAENADFVVVLVHWGIELHEQPELYQIQLGHRYIDAGANLVVGSHPHVVQGFEAYHNGWIAYSLGNFIFTTSNHPATWESMLLDVTWSKESGADLKCLPLYIKWAQPRLMAGEQRQLMLEKLNRLSINTSVNPDGSIRKEE
jgi:poly-gamma-glutamate synthesis protein (capsule biosynthesis protein)